MKVLVTGAKGFVGKNLLATLDNIRSMKDKSFGVEHELMIYEYDLDVDSSMLDKYCADCDIVFHLAGVNRPKNESDFMSGNYGFTSVLLNKLKKYGNTCPIMLSSSIQAALDNPYGRSKKAGEDLLFAYSKETCAKVYIYRFPNIFGKWCRPNYNSAIATFCHNIAHDMPIQVNERTIVMTLVYIDDVVTEMIHVLQGEANMQADGYCYVPVTYTTTLGEVVDLLYSFRRSRTERSIPDMRAGSFSKKLYATYLSYLPEAQFSYPLDMHTDERGSFTEIIRTPERGQFSVNISKPGITKGEHWHHTKNEKFVVVKGKGCIQLRKVDLTELIEYHVSGDKMEVVDIPPGYTHNIINEGDTDMVTFIWCSECFEPEKPDTYFLKVKEKKRGEGNV